MTFCGYIWIEQVHFLYKFIKSQKFLQFIVNLNLSSLHHHLVTALRRWISVCLWGFVFDSILENRSVEVIIYPEVWCHLYHPTAGSLLCSLSHATNRGVFAPKNWISHSCCLLLPIHESPEGTLTSACFFSGTASPLSCECPHSLSLHGLSVFRFHQVIAVGQILLQSTFSFSFADNTGCGVLLILYKWYLKRSAHLSLADCRDSRVLCVSILGSVQLVLGATPK